MLLGKKCKAITNLKVLFWVLQGTRYICKLYHSKGVTFLKNDKKDTELPNHERGKKDKILNHSNKTNKREKEVKESTN